MHRVRAPLLLVGLLLLSSMPMVAATEARAVSCGSTDLGLLPGNFNVVDQACEQIALGSLAPGTVVEFNLSADTTFDLLVFRANALPVYANEQSYRSDVYWASETVFEDLSGAARWHWTVPTDESETNWFVVLDNMAHAGDEGEGAQGGGPVSIDLDITFPQASPWTLFDGLVRLGVNSHSLLTTPADLTLDEGSQIAISAIPMTGDPDVFILTEAQRLSYLDGNSPEFRVPGGDLLAINSERGTSLTIDSSHAGQPLHLYADNEQGPSGGGDGQADAVFTVIVSLLPILDPTIDDGGAGDLDVGEALILSANNTPNLSDQVDTAAYAWDLDEDGTFESSGAWAEVSYGAPGAMNVTLRATGTDGHVATSQHTVSVVDLTAPQAIVNGGTNLVRGYNEDFSLASSSLDNHLIEREDWWVDGSLHSSTPGTGNTFTHSFGTAGNHTVTLFAFDPSGQVGNTTVLVTVQDRTPPVPGTIAGPSEVMAGESHSWSLNANDPQSAGLIWTWDFDRSVDSDLDGDSKNDVEATGSQITWTFTEAGTYSITCTVTNDEGLSSSEEILVIVEAEPVAANAVSQTLMWVLGLVVVIAMGAGAFLWFQRSQRDRAHQEMMEAEAARRAAEEEAAQQEPDHQEQLSMFQRGTGGGGGGWSGRGREDEMSQIAGIGGGYGQRLAVADPGYSSGDDALLAAFAEEDEAPEPEPEAPVVEEKRAPKAEPVAAAEPARAGRATVLSSGIELPGVLHDVAKREAAAAPAPTEPTPATAPVTSAAAAPTPAHSSPVSMAEGTTELTGACASCGQRYAVDMPDGIDEARLDCPKCNARNTIRR